MGKGKVRDLKFLANTPSWQWEEEDGDRILKTLGDSGADGSERLLAAELAAECTMFHEEIAETLLDIVGRNDEMTELREASVISLGPFLEQADLLDFEEEEDLLSAETFRRIQNRLRHLFFDAAVPPSVRRKVLETSVRAFQEWQGNAVRAAYKSNDPEWLLTAVFSMRFVRGFEREILEALKQEDPTVRRHAVCAAGNWGIEEAWSHIVPLIAGRGVDKDLRLAAIDAVAGIRPGEAADLLRGLTLSDDQDIVDAAFEAISMAEGLSGLGNLDDGTDDDPFGVKS